MQSQKPNFGNDQSRLLLLSRGTNLQVRANFFPEGFFQLALSLEREEGRVKERTLGTRLLWSLFSLSAG